jgi:hypothetical protein
MFKGQHLRGESLQVTCGVVWCVWFVWCVMTPPVQPHELLWLDEGVGRGGPAR